MPNTVPVSLAQTSFRSVTPELLKRVLHLLTDQSGSSSRNLPPFLFFNMVSAWWPSSKRGQDGFKSLFYLI